MPELPGPKLNRFVSELGLDRQRRDAALLAGDRAVADYFEVTAAALGGAAQGARTAANWITGELFRLMKAKGAPITAIAVSPAALAALLSLVEGGQLNLNSAKRVLGEMFETGRTAADVMAALGLTQVSDADALRAIVDKVLSANEDQVAKYRAGKESVFNWLLGQIMRETRGKGNPAVVRELLEAALRE